MTPAPTRTRPARAHSAAQEAVFGELHFGRWEPLTSAEIAHRVWFSREAVRWVLNRLLAQGLVERQVLPGAGSRWRYGWRLADAAKSAKGE